MYIRSFMYAWALLLVACLTVSADTPSPVVFYRNAIEKCVDEAVVFVFLSYVKSNLRPAPRKPSLASSVCTSPSCSLTHLYFRTIICRVKLNYCTVDATKKTSSCGCFSYVYVLYECLHYSADMCVWTYWFC